jgi:hypothetical protein
MKAQIQKLIVARRLEEALELLVQIDREAILLQARFARGRQLYNTGQLTFSEWAQEHAKVNYLALEMVNQASPMPTIEQHFSLAPNTQTGTDDGNITHTSTGDGAKRKVFISYSLEYSTVARQVKDFLESNGLVVLIDWNDLPLGKPIMEFIQESIKSSDGVLSIVSAKSLASGWVGQESVVSLYTVWMADKKFIPVLLEDDGFDLDFQIAVQENIQEKLNIVESKISSFQEFSGVVPKVFYDDRNRLSELRNNLDQIIQRLKSGNALKISADLFTPNMAKVLSAIQQK